MGKINNDNLMSPTVDYCFKQLMLNPKVRQGFIAALLRVSPESITETDLLNPIFDQRYEEDKMGVLDVRVLLADQTQMDMEMQVRYFANWEERSLFYTSKMFVDRFKKGAPYRDLAKCIHVSILDYNHYPEDNVCYRTFHLRDDKTGIVYSDKIELHVLELRKLPKDVETADDIVKWMKFFSAKSREEFEEMAKTNEYLEEAYHTLQVLSADEQKRMEYDAREKAINDYNSQMYDFRMEGRQEGRQEAKQIFKLHNQGKTPEEIADICGITLEAVRSTLE